MTRDLMRATNRFPNNVPAKEYSADTFVTAMVNWRQNDIDKLAEITAIHQTHAHTNRPYKEKL
jgi:hypothetical protein